MVLPAVTKDLQVEDEVKYKVENPMADITQNLWETLELQLSFWSILNVPLCHSSEDFLIHSASHIVLDVC